MQFGTASTAKSCFFKNFLSEKTTDKRFRFSCYDAEKSIGFGLARWRTVRRVVCGTEVRTQEISTLVIATKPV